jgi:hypothetical protein
MGYLSLLVTGPVPLVLDLRITHERFGSNSDLNLNGHLHYPNDIDRSINEIRKYRTDKIRKYRSDYTNNTPNSTSFIPVIPDTSGRLDSEFVRLLFLQTHRETYRFLQVQEFSLCILPVDSSTSVTWCSLDTLKEGSGTSFLRMEHYGLL